MAQESDIFHITFSRPDMDLKQLSLIDCLCSLKVHSANKNQLTIPMYGPETQLQKEMNRTRTGDILLVMGIKKMNKRKFRQYNDRFEAYKIYNTRDLIYFC